MAQAKISAETLLSEPGAMENIWDRAVVELLSDPGVKQNIWGGAVVEGAEKAFKDAAIIKGFSRNRGDAKKLYLACLKRKELPRTFV